MERTKIYFYDETGLYTCDGFPAICQITGEDIMFQNSTVIPPPIVELPSVALFDGEKWGVFTPQSEDTVEMPIEEKRKLMMLSAADARLRLAELGLLDRINDTIDAMPKSTPLRIKWEYAPVLHRVDPVLDDFCHETLGLNDEQIDGLFVSA